MTRASRVPIGRVQLRVPAVFRSSLIRVTPTPGNQDKFPQNCDFSLDGHRHYILKRCQFERSPTTKRGCRDANRNVL
jgi:hypothetical protein